MMSLPMQQLSSLPLLNQDNSRLTIVSNNNVVIYFIVTMQTCEHCMHRAFSCDVMAAMLVFQNKEMVAMLVYQSNPPGMNYFFFDANIILLF